MYIKELRDLLQILNKGRIDASNQFTRSTKMRVQFSCGQNSGEQGSYQKCSISTDLNFILNSSSFAKKLAGNGSSPEVSSILSSLDSNFIISLGPECESSSCRYSQRGLGMDAYFMPSVGKEDMYLHFNNVRIFTSPQVATSQDIQVTARAQNGQSFNHSLSQISGMHDRVSIDYKKINKLAQSDACTKEKSNACEGIGNIGGFCSQIGGAMLKPQCCGICAVANQYSVADTIEGKVSKEQFVNYHLETCFKNNRPSIQVAGKTYRASCGSSFVTVDGVLLKNSEPTAIEEGGVEPFFSAGDLEKGSLDNPKQGTVFDDRETVEVNGPMTGIAFRAGKRIDAVYRYHRDGSVKFNGGICGNSFEEDPSLKYELRKDEYFTKATLCYCKKPFGAIRVTRLCGARFDTNQTGGQRLPFAVNMDASNANSGYTKGKATCHTYEKPGKAIVGLHGMYREGEEVTYLAPYFAEISKINEKAAVSTTSRASSVPSFGNNPNATAQSRPQAGNTQSSCTDIAPTQQYSCQQQAAWGKCNESWMAGKCNRSCNRCQ